MDRKRCRAMGPGKVFSAKDACGKIRAAASLVQLMTATIYKGPGVLRKITAPLCSLLKRDGSTNFFDAVGAGDVGTLG